MAGGIDWFRWHHGSVNDPKFQLVAKRSGSSVAEVIAVWACVLEAASKSEQRGCAGNIDFEAIDCALGIDDGMSSKIIDAMRARDLIKGEELKISSWDKRQLKREREVDDSAAERKRQQRERDAEKSNVTPCHAMSHQKTPREEERREEKNVNTLTNPNGLVVASDAVAESASQDEIAKTGTNCPHQEIIALYHEVLPQCPKVRDWTPARATQLRARWNEDSTRQNMTYWRRFFEYVKTCDFLVGVQPDSRKTPFFADLEWMVKQANFTKIRERKYEPR